MINESRIKMINKSKNNPKKKLINLENNIYREKLPQSKSKLILNSIIILFILFCIFTIFKLRQKKSRIKSLYEKKEKINNPEIFKFDYSNYNNNQNIFNNITKDDENFFFGKTKGQLNYCNNYGLLVYDYYSKGNVNEYTDNIGDYIQSLAALQFLPKNCFPFLVDRDSIRFYHGPKIKLIISGFFGLSLGNIKISEQINPLFISYHINDDQFKNFRDIFTNLKKFQPIGCRDLSTQKKLEREGIEAYFSGCLTTTLDIDYAAKDSERTDEIIFIDYKIGEYSQADNFLLSLKAYNFSKIIKITHHFNITYGHLDRFKIAKSLLNRYARAKLVVSTRVHGALPCLALRTPVIFINYSYDYNRFPGLYELLNTVGKNAEGKFETKVNLDKNGLVYNSDKYLEYANKLKEKLKYI